jgi:hypothetical protein
MTDIFQGQLDSQVVKDYDSDIPPIAEWAVRASKTEVTFYRTKGKIKEMEIWVKQKMGTTGKYCYTRYIYNDIKQTLRELTYEKMLELGFEKRLKDLKLENPKGYNQKLKKFIEQAMKKGIASEIDKFAKMIKRGLAKKALKQQ